MLIWLILFFEILIMFLTSRVVFNSLFIFFNKIFRSKNIAITFISIIFFPGIVIHELSHLLVAELLGVRTGNLDFVPKIQDGKVKMGSVQVERADPIRNFIIGIAPVILGGSFLFFIIAFFLEAAFSNVFSSFFNIFKASLFIWVVFFTTNTMFSSKKDMESTLEVFIFMALLVLFLYVLNFDILDFLKSYFLSEKAIEIAKTASFAFVLPVGINTLFLLLSLFFLKRRELN